MYSASVQITVVFGNALSPVGSVTEVPGVFAVPLAVASLQTTVALLAASMPTLVTTIFRLP